MRINPNRFKRISIKRCHLNRNGIFDLFRSLLVGEEIVVGRSGTVKMSGGCKLKLYAEQSPFPIKFPLKIEFYKRKFHINVTKESLLFASKDSKRTSVCKIDIFHLLLAKFTEKIKSFHPNFPISIKIFPYSPNERKKNGKRSPIHTGKINQKLVFLLSLKKITSNSRFLFNLESIEILFMAKR